MKYLIASDVHGSYLNMKKIIEISKSEKVDKIILLGDIYNHGPRNPLPDGFDEMALSTLLNSEKDNLIVVKGNCDSQVDTLISEFDFIEDVVLEVSGKNFLLTHGHIYNKDSKPKTKFDGIIYGHFHTGFIEKIDGTIFANAGSISLPKSNTPKSFLILDSEKLSLFDLDKNLIKSINI